MVSKKSKPAASVLLALNIFLYFIMIILSSWAINHGIERSNSAYYLTLPAKIFPIYFPIGNTVTGFFVILSLIAGVVGFTTSLTGLYNVNIWNGANLHSAGASSLISFGLTLLAMGFACKEIEIGWTDTEFKFESNLRTLEVFSIIVSATQIFSTFAIQAGVEEAISHEKFRAGRV